MTAFENAPSSEGVETTINNAPRRINKVIFLLTALVTLTLVVLILPSISDFLDQPLYHGISTDFHHDEIPTKQHAVIAENTDKGATPMDHATTGAKKAPVTEGAKRRIVSKGANRHDGTNEANEGRVTEGAKKDRVNAGTNRRLDAEGTKRRLATKGKIKSLHITSINNATKKKGPDNAAKSSSKGKIAKQKKPTEVRTKSPPPANSIGRPATISTRTKAGHKNIFASTMSVEGITRLLSEMHIPADNEQLEEERYIQPSPKIKRRTFMNIHGNLDAFKKDMRNGRIIHSLLAPNAVATWSAKILPKFQYNASYRSPCFFSTLGNQTEIETFGKKNKLTTEMTAFLIDKYQRHGRVDFLRCLPSFFIAGFPKSATTDLFERVVPHPNITMGLRKECHWWPGNKTVNDYLRIFSRASFVIQHHNSQLLTVDGSASTAWNTMRTLLLPGFHNHPEPLILVSHLIKAAIPKSKFVLILRNPAERLHSDYKYFYDKSGNKSRFYDAVSEGITFFLDCFRSYSIRQCSYNWQNVNITAPDTMRGVRLWIGLYYVYIRDLMDVFSRDQLHILRTEDYSTNKRAALIRIANFLEIGEYPEATLSKGNKGKKNAGRSRGVMLNSTREVLTSFYMPFNIKLADLLEDRSFLWL